MSDFSGSVEGPKGDPRPQGPKGDTGVVDTSAFYDKAQSDTRYARVETFQVTATEAVSIPPGTQTTLHKLACPSWARPGKGAFEVSGFPSNTALGTVDDTGYSLTINNTTLVTLTGVVRKALSCVAAAADDAPAATVPALG